MVGQPPASGGALVRGHEVDLAVAVQLTNGDRDGVGARRGDLVAGERYRLGGTRWRCGRR
jgi:hypothetical protein